MTKDLKVLTLGYEHRMLRHMDYGWANTVHSFQGATVRDNIAIMRADHNPLNTLEALYVGASRHREKLVIITDNKDQLLKRVSEKLEISKERIEFKEPRRMNLFDAQKVISAEAQKQQDRLQETKPENDQKPFDLEKYRKERSRGDRSR